MELLDPAIVRHLRNMAREGNTAAQMLRYILHALAPSNPHKLTLIQYMREAFCLSLQQASPIAGWAPDGSGDLQDGPLDGFLMPEITANRSAWDSEELVPG